MPQVLYVGLQDDDSVAVYGIDDAGRLTKSAEVAVAGGPSVMALANDRRTLYVGTRTAPAMSSFQVGADGALTLLGSAPQADAPTFLAPDRTGKYMLVAYYQGGYAAVYRLAADGTVGACVDKHETAIGAHAIATDRSNRYAFVPHIAFVQDNVLEPPKNIPGPNFIAQFKFDVATGKLSPNAPPARLEPAERVGPRHYCFHPGLDVVYFSNEQGCSVTAYKLDGATGTLSAAQTISTLPAGFTARNTCSQIHLTPSARFLYVGNRGHNSIAGFAVDATSGRLTPAGHVPTEAVPSAFCLDSTGRFIFAAGTATGRLASYRVDQGSGALAPLQTYDVGKRPAAVAAVSL